MYILIDQYRYKDIAVTGTAVIGIYTTKELLHGALNHYANSLSLDIKEDECANCWRAQSDDTTHLIFEMEIIVDKNYEWPIKEL